MRIGVCSSVVVATLLLAGAALASVSMDYDHSVDFSRYQTYSWKQVQTVDRIWDDRVKRAIESQLAAKGWRQVPSGGDVLVSAIGVTRPEEMFTGTLSGMPSGPFGGFGGFGGGFGTATINKQTYEVGTLVIHMFDGTSNLLVLRGVATGSISAKPEKDSKKLESEIRKMFKKFPPGSNAK